MLQPSLFSAPLWSVSKVTRYLRELLEGDHELQDLWLQGEISNFARPGSGHLYFTLKDSGAALKCVMWKTAAARLKFAPRDGQQVEVHGYISIYDAGGQYQLYADVIRPAGEGALYQEFLRLKARLEAEGLFDPDRKRPIPPLPKRIGIVTSPSGAALRDMLNTLRRRYPLAEVILASTSVQGDDAPPRIVAALDSLARLSPPPDVILLGRGGGSIEDLWAFNDERVARAIAASPIPVISGVGHETDFTIADFVSDLRAPTPTAAAELAVPNRADLLAELNGLDERLTRSAAAGIDLRRLDVDRLSHRLSLRSPAARIRAERQRLDELDQRGSASLRGRLRLDRARLSGLDRRLIALDPLAVLRRGYAIVSRPNGNRLRSAAEAGPGDPLIVQLTGGQLDVHVVKVKQHE
jgi:exodeoxyribonuclease VII large subunit